MTNEELNTAVMEDGLSAESATSLSEVTDADIRKVTFRWICLNTSAWSYERMQNSAFAWSLIPVLEKVYTKKEDLAAALERHMAFFNTEMVIGSPILGVTAAMETQRAKGADVPDDLIDAVKTGLMGPLAALGDSLWGSTANALLLSICMDMCMNGNVAGAIIYIVVWTALVIAGSLFGVRLGYKEGMNIMDSPLFDEKTISTVTHVLGVLGLTVMGGLAAGFVSLTTPITWGSGEAVTQLQTIFDGIMPGLLPFAVVMLAWYLHDRKNMSILKLLGLLIAVGAAGSLIGIFG